VFGSASTASSDAISESVTKNRGYSRAKERAALTPFSFPPRAGRGHWQGCSQERQDPLRSILRHCLQRSSRGRPVRKIAPACAAPHGYLEQLKHQCHVSLSDARTYTGMTRRLPCQGMTRHLPCQALAGFLSCKVVHKRERCLSHQTRGVPARALPSAQQSAPAESQGAREVWLARATSVRATRSGRRASGRPVTHCFAPPARDHALPKRAQRRAHVLSPFPCA
jgi:hypothetical protein